MTTMYDALFNASKEESVGNQPVRIYRGQISKLFSATGIGAGYYSEVFRQLESQGCITYLQRGSKNVDTVIVLHFPPDPEHDIPPAKSPLTSAEESANLFESVEMLKELVGGIDIAEALVELDRRVRSLEAKAGTK